MGWSLLRWRRGVGAGRPAGLEVWKRLGMVVLAAGVVCVVLGVGAGFASAASGVAPWWGLYVGARPGVLSPGGSGVLVVTAENLGDGQADGSVSPVVVSALVPEGLTVVSLEGRAGAASGSTSGVLCSGGGAGPRTVSCSFTGVLYPYEPLEMRVGVSVAEDAGAGLVSVASVSGGGAVEGRSITRPVRVGGAAGFGVEEFELTPEEAGGRVDSRAGSHPFQLTSVVTLNQGPVRPSGEVWPVGMPKEVRVDSPVGLVGNPTPVEQCSESQFTTIVEQAPLCPVGSVIGVASLTFSGGGKRYYDAVTPIYNLVALEGEPARFGFYAAVFPVSLQASVASGGDYHVVVSSQNITQLAGLLSARVTLWGVPGDSRHDGQRGARCLAAPGSCGSSTEPASTPPAFLSLPTSCDGPWQVGVQVDSWEDPAEKLSFGPSETEPEMVGCEAVPFGPSVSVSPDKPYASSPSGLSVGVHLPQAPSVNPEGIAEGAIRQTTVVLPAGVTLNPGGGSGLEGCDEKQVGFEGENHSEPLFNLFVFSAALPSNATEFCPAAAKVATVTLQTPVLPRPLTGAVYIAEPAPLGEAGENPFDSLIAMYIVAEDRVSGALVKLAGQVSLCQTVGQVLDGVACQAAGQLISSFKDTPQLPFEDLTMHFFGGGSAPLAMPAHCGAYTTTARFVPWSGGAAASSSSTFQIDAGPEGGSCPPDPQPFTPEFLAGTTDNQAGRYSSFLTSFGHPDIDQALDGASITLPPGLAGSLSHVSLCGEPQASEGTCPPESLIGHTTVTAGLGKTPLLVKPQGEVYITGPYDGHGACTVSQAGCAPFGLSITSPAKAGPFDLMKGSACDCVVVRAKLEIDPHTAQVKITTNQPGVPQSIPTILDGIPLDLQHMQVTVDRPQFTFNPTSCEKMSIEATLQGSEGATHTSSMPFQAAGCRGLAFKPKLTATIHAHHSRKDGQYMHVTIQSGEGQANIAKVHVVLPTQLPARESTLNQACTETQFAADPQGCPEGSIVGTASAHTPALPVPLTGPAIFVSHGGAAYPDLDLVLKGDGVTIIQTGHTKIHKGRTTSTFQAIPDVPVSRIDLTLPAGPHSALGANGNLCTRTITNHKQIRIRRHKHWTHKTITTHHTIARKLQMPTTITAQNGKTIKHNTTITVTGCHKR